MGNTVYYSFLIEPDKLLKFCYVLHRNSSHSTKDLSPSYQRVIKKDRLNKIREFVNAGGFFPNSIIISIDTRNSNEKELQFDSAGKVVDGTRSRIGVLHLPKTYQSAFVIDGQHRLYGYSNSDFASTDTIPVVAFVNMDKSDQVKMFMDINQNQKPVAKNLRNTLEEFLLWDSKKQDEVRKAIMLRTSMHLGTDNKSALYKRIITGENAKTQTMCITLETMRLAFARTNFFNSYKNGQIKENGLFDFGDNRDEKDKTLEYVCSIVENFFDGISNNLPDLWEAGDNSYLCINNTVYGLIVLLSEFVTYLVKRDNIDTKIISSADLNKLITTELVDVVSVILSDISEEDVENHLLKRGAGGTAEAGRYLCYCVHQQINDFSPEWLGAYIDDYFQNNKEEAKDLTIKILDESRTLFRKLLKERHGDNWEIMGVEPHVKNSLSTKKDETDRTLIKNGGTIGNTDILTYAEFSDLDVISRYNSNWSNCFSKYYKNKKKLFEDEKNILSKLKSIHSDVTKEHNIRKKDFEDLKVFFDDFMQLVNSDGDTEE